MANSTGMDYIRFGCNMSTAAADGLDDHNCPYSFWSRIFFFATFLLLCAQLTFSFTRHHIKYSLCPTWYIKTERHRVVFSLAWGCFARALSFVVAPGFMGKVADVHTWHVILRVFKDVCFMVAFSFVIVFWLQCLVLFRPKRLLNAGRCAKLVQGACIFVFASVRVIVAVGRLTFAADDSSSASDVLYGMLVAAYATVFVVAFVYGMRLRRRLRFVGPAVENNLRRLTAFMIWGGSCCLLILLTTFLRFLMFSSKDELLRPYDHPELYMLLNFGSKFFELMLVTTLALMMLARGSAGRGKQVPARLSAETMESSAPNDELAIATSELPPTSTSRSHVSHNSKSSLASQSSALFSRQSFYDLSLESPSTIELGTTPGIIAAIDEVDTTGSQEVINALAQREDPPQQSDAHA